MAEARPVEKGPWIEDLEIGDHFVGYYLAVDARLERFRDPERGHFLRLRLVDRTGSLEARVWEEAEEAAALLETPRVIKVEGEVESFQGQRQVRILRYRAARQDEVLLEDFIRTTRRDRAAMLAALDEAVASIENPHLAALLRAFYDDPDFRARLMEAPAAKRIHHAYRGGLLEHLYEVLRLAEPLMELYPELDRDLLVTGILLHDIGKLEELTPDLETDYTDRGRLLGHVVIGSERVGEIIRRLEGFPEELALRLQHMILAHHGRYKWGSPRRPKTLEAVALHHLENLDTQVNRFRELLEAARARGLAWTDYDRLLGRSLYAGDGTDLSAEERGQAE